MSTTQKAAPGFWQMQVSEREGSLKALEDAIRAQGGNPQELMDLFRTDPQYANLIAQAMLRRGHVDSVDMRLARLILGNNIFCLEEWETLYGAKFTKKQRRDAGKFPWSESVLTSACPFNPGKQVKDTHFAFLGVTGINGTPLTVAQWNVIHPATGQPKFYFNSNPWHAGQPYADTATLELKWYLILKEIVPNSTGKTPEDQVAMLPAEYETPATIAEVTKDILAFRKLSIRLNPSHWAACTERTIKTAQIGSGHVSCVGRFDEFGLHVAYWDGLVSGLVGVGASRKSN